jgi:hypothetical protein
MMLLRLDRKADATGSRGCRTQAVFVMLLRKLVIRDQCTHVDQSLEDERMSVSKLDECGVCCLVEVPVDWHFFPAPSIL